MAGKVVASPIPSSSSTYTKGHSIFFTGGAGTHEPCSRNRQDATHHRLGRGRTGTAPVPLLGHPRGKDQDTGRRSGIGKRGDCAPVRSHHSWA